VAGSGKAGSHPASFCANGRFEDLRQLCPRGNGHSIESIFAIFPTGSRAYLMRTVCSPNIRRFLPVAALRNRRNSVRLHFCTPLFGRSALSAPPLYQQGKQFVPTNCIDTAQAACSRFEEARICINRPSESSDLNRLALTGLDLGASLDQAALHPEILPWHP
jgi:hypothetical protein